MFKVTKLEIKFGDIEYRNEQGEWHREDGPAIVYADGKQEWWLNGRRHREDGPAVIYADGTEYWYRNGQYHREDGPALIYSDGSQAWYVNGELHREDGPAIIRADGSQQWFVNGLCHRVDGPASIRADGTEYWYRNGEVHRVDGPARIWADGSQSWCVNGLLHREDGPAVIYADGRQEWYLIGRRVTKKLVEKLDYLTANLIHKRKNVELRSWLIQRMGWPKYLREVNAKPIDTRDNDVENTKEALYLISELNQNQLIVTCPTGRVFSLHVPEEIKTCEAAQRWLGNDVKNKFNVIGRT